MATVTLNRARVARTISGNSPQVLSLPEGTSLGVKKGELVYLSGGYVTEIGDNPGVILGMADADAANGVAGAADIAVVIANSDTIFEFHKVSDTTTASATATGAATAVTDVGSVFGIHRDTTANKVYATLGADGKGAGTDARLLCLDHSNFDTVGDTGGRLLVMVAGNFRQLFSTS